MLTILVLMAGKSDAFREAGFQYPKNLVEIDGAPLAQRVLDGLSALDGPDTRIVCLVRRDENRRFHTNRVLQLLRPSTAVVEVNGDTGGAACTALLAIQHIAPDQPLLIVNGDIVIDYPLDAVLRDFAARNLDGGVTGFRDVHPRWSFVQLDESGHAVEFAEKRPISDLATTGFSWFARGEDFITAASAMLAKDAHVDGQYFIAPTYNELILTGRRVGCHPIPKGAYHSLKTPQDVRAYEEHLLARRRQSA